MPFEAGLAGRCIFDRHCEHRYESFEIVFIILTINRTLTDYNDPNGTIRESNSLHSLQLECLLQYATQTTNFDHRPYSLEETGELSNARAAAASVTPHETVANAGSGAVIVGIQKCHVADFYAFFPFD